MLCFLFYVFIIVVILNFILFFKGNTLKLQFSFGITLIITHIKMSHSALENLIAYVNIMLQSSFCDSVCY